MRGVKGVKIPETILYKEGKAKCLLYFSRREDIIIGVYENVHLQVHRLMKFMTKKYREREELPVLNLFARLMSSSYTRKQIKVVEALMGTIKYNHMQNAKHITQKGFLELMMERASSKVWHNLSYIQNCVVVSRSFPETFIYSYNAKDSNKSIEIKLNENIIELQAKHLCNTIGKHLLKVHGIVINRITNRNSFI